MTAQILSYGGGTQTVAMCLLVAQGHLAPPDYIIAADTGREMPTTWEYLNTHIRPLMARRGLDIHIAGHEYSTIDTHSQTGDLMIPAYTTTGKLPTFCSIHWKRRVVQRYAARALGVAGAMSDQEHWIGFSLDEKHRAGRAVDKDHTNRYPLIELMLTSADCRAVIERAGLPLPKKSRCWMCPHQHNAEWREVRADPALWAQAVEMDAEFRDADDRGGVWLHDSRQPLATAPIDTDDDPRADRQCALGLCFV